jgi:hypothetical protein
MKEKSDPTFDGNTFFHRVSPRGDNNEIKIEMIFLTLYSFTKNKNNKHKFPKI